MNAPMERIIDPKIGFEIGWDYVAHGLLLPAQLREYKDIVQGYKEARERQIHVTAHDRYVRKWLQLRTNAWKRSRIFDTNVDPGYLRDIDVTHCPVTLTKLQHGSSTVFDWSLDRVNNDGAYARGNLVVVSTLANIAKNAYTLEDIIAFAYNNGRVIPKCYPGMPRALTRIEWARWAVICAHAGASVNEHGDEELVFAAVPCVIQPPTGLVMNSAAELQTMIAMKHYIHAENKIYALVASKLPKPKRRAMHHVANLVHKKSHAGQCGMDIWFNHRIYLEFMASYRTLGHQERHMVLDCRRADGCHYERMEARDWGISSGGYL